MEKYTLTTVGSARFKTSVSISHCISELLRECQRQVHTGSITEQIDWSTPLGGGIYFLPVFVLSSPAHDILPAAFVDTDDANLAVFRGGFVSELLSAHTERSRLIRDGEPRTTTSTFTPAFLSSVPGGIILLTARSATSSVVPIASFAQEKMVYLKMCGD